MKSKVIAQDPEIMHGMPVFAGTRVPVALFFEFISLGGTVEQFVEQYPTVKPEQLTDLIADAQREFIPA